MADLQLRVPTESLRKLLQEEPTIWLKLESMATEKIAEEITRKAQSITSPEKMNRLVSEIVDQVRREATSQLGSKIKFPEALSKVVVEIASDALKAQRLNLINEFRDEVNKLFTEVHGNTKKYMDQLLEQHKSEMAEMREELTLTSEKIYASHAENLTRLVQEQAHATFVQVVKDARI